MKNIFQLGKSFTKFSTVLIAGAIALTLLSENTSAATIQYTLSGTGSGVYAGNSFTDQAFTITGVADTANLGTLNLGMIMVPRVLLDSMIIDIAGNPLATVPIPFYMYNFTPYAVVSPSLANVIGFEDVTSNDGTVFKQAGAGAWDLISEYGPIAPAYYSSGLTTTDQGLIRISSFTASTTFTATFIPEPSSALIASIAAIALLLRRRA